jgi:TM2 domain-containing membrane protein YozV
VTGWLPGVDRFYLGKVGTGILKLLANLGTFFTLGLIWVVIDIILIATKKLTDKEGLKLA